MRHPAKLSNILASRKKVFLRSKMTMLLSTQEPLSDKDILTSLVAVDIDDQHESNKDNSQSEVSDVLLKQNPSQVRVVLDTLMNYLMIIGTAKQK